MTSPSLQRLLIDQPPFGERRASTPWNGRGPWNASWIRCAAATVPPVIVAYRLRFHLAADTAVRLHVSADERYELFLDGVRLGRGSERGDILHWFFETYAGTLAAGNHVLVARVWSLGPQAPMAQITSQPGFLLAAEPAALSGTLDTGVARWEACVLHGYTFQSPLAAWGTGANVVLDGTRFPWGFESGSGGDWQPAEIACPATDDRCVNLPVSTPVLRPSQLPPLLDRPVTEGQIRHVAPVPLGQVSAIPIRASEHLADEARTWQALYAGRGTVTIPPRTRRRVLLDLGNYYCAYHQVTLTGGRGAHLEIHWQESLYDTAEAKTKGDRNAIEGKFYTTTWHLIDGIGDSFQADGGSARTFESLWWHCGRYLQVLVETAAEPLVVERLQLAETRYPLEMQASFATSDASLAGVIPLAWRTLQMCSHETYMDCPYFEQLQYAGDARLEALVTYATTTDRRLPAKAVQAFDWSRAGFGLTQSRYPSGVRQIIPAFSLFWVGMVHDFFLWADDPALVRSCLPGVREVLSHWLAHLREDGSLGGIEGWNYLDWLPEWTGGVPPDGKDGGGSGFHFLLQLALGQAAELEQQLGEKETAALYRRHAATLQRAALNLYWNEARGLFADDRAHQHFSEHAQCLALLVGAVRGPARTRLARGLLRHDSLSRTTIYFTHYLFEAYRKIGATDHLVQRLELWRQLGDRGLKTTIEAPEPARSDCHAWASHPLYHYLATLLGIRPSAPGFSAVSIAPQLGSLEWAHGTLPHPRGNISVEARRVGASLNIVVQLPPGLTGELCHGRERRALTPGKSAHTFERSARPRRGVRA